MEYLELYEQLYKKIRENPIKITKNEDYFTIDFNSCLGLIPKKEEIFLNLNDFEKNEIFMVYGFSLGQTVHLESDKKSEKIFRTIPYSKYSNANYLVVERGTIGYLETQYNNIVFNKKSKVNTLSSLWGTNETKKMFLSKGNRINLISFINNVTIYSKNGSNKIKQICDIKNSSIIGPIEINKIVSVEEVCFINFSKESTKINEIDKVIEEFNVVGNVLIKKIKTNKNSN